VPNHGDLRRSFVSIVAGGSVTVRAQSGHGGHLVFRDRVGGEQRPDGTHRDLAVVVIDSRFPSGGSVPASGRWDGRAPRRWRRSLSSRRVAAGRPATDGARRALRTRARSPPIAVPSQRYRPPSERCPTLQPSTESLSTERGAVHTAVKDPVVRRHDVGNRNRSAVLTLEVARHCAVSPPARVSRPPVVGIVQIWRSASTGGRLC
jgi:hypothetical protein